MRDSVCLQHGMLKQLRVLKDKILLLRTPLGPFEHAVSASKTVIFDSVLWESLSLGNNFCLIMQIIENNENICMLPRQRGHFKVSRTSLGNRKCSCSHVSNCFAFPLSCWPKGFMLEILITLAFAIVHPLVLVYRNLQFNQITINHGIHHSTSISPHMLYPGTLLHIHMHKS